LHFAKYLYYSGNRKIYINIKKRKKITKKKKEIKKMKFYKKKKQEEKKHKHKLEFSNYTEELRCTEWSCKYTEKLPDEELVIKKHNAYFEFKSQLEKFKETMIDYFIERSKEKYWIQKFLIYYKDKKLFIPDNDYKTFDELIKKRFPLDIMDLWRDGYFLNYDDYRFEPNIFPAENERLITIKKPYDVISNENYHLIDYLTCLEFFLDRNYKIINENKKEIIIYRKKE
jgi:hypothetical protein